MIVSKILRPPRTSTMQQRDCGLTLTIFSISSAWLGNFIMSFPMEVSSFGWLAVLFTQTFPFEQRRIRIFPASSILILTPWEEEYTKRASIKLQLISKDRGIAKVHDHPVPPLLLSEAMAIWLPGQTLNNNTADIRRKNSFRGSSSPLRAKHTVNARTEQATTTPTNSDSMQNEYISLGSRKNAHFVCKSIYS